MTFEENLNNLKSKFIESLMAESEDLDLNFDDSNLGEGSEGDDSNLSLNDLNVPSVEEEVNVEEADNLAEPVEEAGAENADNAAEADAQEQDKEDLKAELNKFKSDEISEEDMVNFVFDMFNKALDAEEPANNNEEAPADNMNNAEEA